MKRQVTGITEKGISGVRKVGGSSVGKRLVIIIDEFPGINVSYWLAKG